MDADSLTFDTAWAAHFDAQDAPLRASLAILSTPRTGSQSLCRLLYAMGLGVPAEYFLQRVTEHYGERFLGGVRPVGGAFMKDYVRAIETYRCRNGYLAYKIHADQHRQLSADLGKAWEDTLPNLTIIRLRRRDIVGQVVSFGAAFQTGIWDDASAELLKRPSAVNAAIAERWVEYIFSSERYWDRYLENKTQRILSLDCEDLADAEKLQATLSVFGTGHSSAAIGHILKRLPRSSHNNSLSRELAQRFGAHILRHWQHLLAKAAT
jgi:LPS sulfotransferase NodH